MADTLKGKAYVVTGASEGIGFAIAKRLVDDGAQVFITGRRESALAEAAAAIGGAIIPVRADSGNVSDIGAAFARIAQDAPAIDGLVVSAGIVGGGVLGHVGEAEFDRIFAVNAKGTLFTVQYALPLLRDGSSIVVMSSVHGLKGNPGSSVYSATKAAIRSFARNWIIDLADRRIRVNVVSPGAIRSEGFDRLFPNDEMRGQVIAHLASMAPSRRIGMPKDVADTVRFLLDDQSSFINGADIHVDGGMAQI